MYRSHTEHWVAAIYKPSQVQRELDEVNALLHASEPVLRDVATKINKLLLIGFNFYCIDHPRQAPKNFINDCT